MRIRDITLNLTDRCYVFAAWGTLLAVYHLTYRAFFPTQRGTLGHDFGLALAGNVDGFIWFLKNGPLEVPWFTPSFCGGVPFFADPQSGYYSVPQWLTFVMDPLTAAYLTLLLFASLGYFGIYALARQGFRLPLSWSIFASALFFFNTFFPYRTIIGEYGYLGFALAPWLAYFLIRPAAAITDRLAFSLLAGGIAAYWLQSGLTTLMVPATLSIALILLVYRLRQPWPRDLPGRIFVALGVTLAFSVSKLVASLSFYSRFERTQYLLPGFTDPFVLFQTSVLALFGSSEKAYAVTAGHLVNAQWAVLPHEWAYSFTLTPIFIILAARVLNIPQTRNRGPNESTAAVGRSDRTGISKTQAVALTIAAISLIPLALQLYTPELNAWYKGLPLIGATAFPMRWLIVYLPVLPIATALVASHMLGARTRQAPWLVGGSIVMLIALTLADSKAYYADQPYRPGALLDGYSRLATGAVKEQRIRAIGVMTDPDPWAPEAKARRNDLVVEGISQAQCYSPAFGYRLERFPRGRLVVGDVMAESEGYLNIKNPACYVFPEENKCAPGDHFRVAEREKAEAFVSYAPFPFNKSRLQRTADLVTMGTLITVGAFLLFLWPWFSWRRRRTEAHR